MGGFTVYQHARLTKKFAGVSLSHATLRTEDLIKSFVDFIQSEIDPNYSKLLIKEYAIDFDNLEKWIDDNTEDASWLLNEQLFNLLNSFAPEGCYFGSHPGDGTDFGFWQVEEDL